MLLWPQVLLDQAEVLRLLEEIDRVGSAETLGFKILERPSSWPHTADLAVNAHISQAIIPFENVTPVIP